MCITAFALLGTLAGCASPKNDLGTSASPCFRALPVAHAALHGKGKLLGVRYLTVSEIDQGLSHTHQRRAFVARIVKGVRSPICTVGYEGMFVASALPHPWPKGRRTAHFVLVLVDIEHIRLLATVLLTRPPLRLSKI